MTVQVECLVTGALLSSAERCVSVLQETRKPHIAHALICASAQREDRGAARCDAHQFTEQCALCCTEWRTRARCRAQQTAAPSARCM